MVDTEQQILGEHHCYADHLVVSRRGEDWWRRHLSRRLNQEEHLGLNMCVSFSLYFVGMLTILISPGNHLRNILRTSPNIVKSLHCEAVPGVLVQVVDDQGHLLPQIKL